MYILLRQFLAVLAILEFTKVYGQQAGSYMGLSGGVFFTYDTLVTYELYILILSIVQVVIIIVIIHVFNQYIRSS